MEIKDWLESFNTVRKNDVLSRDMSYDLCREFFINNYKDPEKDEEMALHLYAFLASWGMLRNAFLLSKNYRFLLPVVKKLFGYEHEGLINWEPQFNETDNDTIEEIIRLKEDIVGCFEGQTFYTINAEEKSIENVTDTLVSKIMLGTLGCVPAYDSYFVRALKEHGIAQTFNANSLKGIVAFIKDNRDTMETVKRSIFDPKFLYTQMRVADMILWWEGYELIREEERKKKEQ